MDEDLDKVVEGDELVTYRKVADVLAEDMRVMRRLGEAHDPDFIQRSLIGLVHGYEPQRLQQEIEQYVSRSSSAGNSPQQSDTRQQQLIVRKIFLSSEDRGLVKRRRALADSLGLSDRTIIRIEDSFIQSFTDFVAWRVGQDAVLRQAVAGWFAAKRNVQPIPLTADDLPNMVAEQAEALNVMSQQLQSLTDQLAELMKSNQKMAKMLGK